MATKKTKKGLNNKTLLLIIVIVAVVAGGGMLLMGGGTGGGGFVPETSTDETLASSAVSSNGFKFNLKDGWVIHEDGNTVIIRNTDETVAIKLENVDNDFSKISKTTVTSYFSSSASFANTKVEETKISAKDAYLVNTNSGEIPVQVYYINGGTNLTIGATIVYQSKASKDKYEAAVTELIGTVSYADDSLKAIDTVQMYSDIFGTYKGVFEHTPSGGTTIEEPTDPTDQQTPQDEETENETEEVEEEAPEQEDTVENEEI